MMMSGLRNSRFICRRRTWKYCAGVVRLQTWILSSAAELEEALQASAGMLRPLPFVAMRKEQHDAAGALPFRFRGDDELIDDVLRAVREITELRLPNAKHLRVIERVAVVETEHRGLREQTVINADLRLARERDGVTECSGSPVCGIVKHRMPVTERSAPAVLTGKTNGRAFQE